MQNKISRRGWLGALISFSLLFSISEAFRLPIAGLLVHPYLVLLPFALYVGSFKLWLAPSKILLPLLIYGIILSFSVLREANFGEIIKIIAGIVTFLFFFQSVQTEKDFFIITLGFIGVGVLLAFRTSVMAQSGEVSVLSGVNALEGLGNKNAQSQFTLPALFFCAYHLIHYRRKGVWPFLWLICIAILTAGIIYTGNRSGYIGILVIGAIVLRVMKFSVLNIVLIIILAYISMYFLTDSAFDVLERKIDQTTGPYQSNSQRRMLFINSILIGLENPLFGLGKMGLEKELASRIQSIRSHVDPHNLYGYLLGGGGIFSFLAFIIFTFNLWAKGMYFKRLKNRLKPFRKLNIHLWFWGFIFLFMIRSLFTRELIYSPNFMGGMGLLFGLLLYYQRQIIVFYASLQKP